MDGSLGFLAAAFGVTFLALAFYIWNLQSRVDQLRRSLDQLRQERRQRDENDRG